MVLELESLNIETTELQLAIVRLARGVSRKINITSRPYHFICPEYEKISIGDWVVVEVKRKTHNKNIEHDFRVGRVDEIMTWTDKEILTFRPNSFVVCKLEESDKFEKRCININNKKKSLWARYNAVDRKINPDKKVEGVPMNIFDNLLDNTGKLHFDKLNKYSHKMTSEKKKIKKKRQLE